MSVPVAPLRAIEPAPLTADVPTPLPTIAAVPVGAEAVTLAGAVDSNPATVSDAQGPGAGGGADRGTGPGTGAGRGSGLDDGDGGNSGSGYYRAGNGVTAPRLLRSVRPQYTADAMRARITGLVVLDCVIAADGHVGRCDVRRSLDSAFGLDEEAIKAAQVWTFAPGTRSGEPVPVVVTIEVSFSIQ